MQLLGTDCNTCLTVSTAGAKIYIRRACVPSSKDSVGVAADRFQGGGVRMRKLCAAIRPQFRYYHRTCQRLSMVNPFSPTFS